MSEKLNIFSVKFTVRSEGERYHGNQRMCGIWSDKIEKLVVTSKSMRSVVQHIIDSHETLTSIDEIKNLYKNVEILDG